MSTFIFIHDIVESNGKTIKENNLARQHGIPMGALVEIEGRGVRLFVVEHRRDCDGTPLYSLGANPLPAEYEPRHHGYPEYCLQVVASVAAPAPPEEER